MNQSESPAITCNLLKAREKSSVQCDWFWFCFSLVEKHARFLCQSLSVAIDAHLQLLCSLNFSNAECDQNYCRYNNAQSIQNKVLSNTNRTCIALFVSQCPSHIFRLLRKKKIPSLAQFRSRISINQSHLFGTVT